MPANKLRSSVAAEANPARTSTNDHPDALAAPFCERPVENVVFISPHFPHHFVAFIQALKERNLNVLGIGDTPFDTLSQDLKSNLTEYIYVPNLADYEAMLRTCGYFTSKFGRIDRIDSLNESWLEIEARLRADFRVPGLQPADIDRGRAKKGMHDIFKAAGIPHPDCILVTTAEALEKFAGRVGYPLVLKPNIGVGSRGTFKVQNAAEVKAAFEKQSMEGYVAQPFISGTIVTWDGVVDRHGQILFHVSTEYTDGCMDVVLDRRDTTMFTLLKTSPELDRFGAMAVRALGLRERFFHLEFFRLDKDGSYMILEANLRCPGVLMLHQINFTCDIDVYRGWVKVLLGEEVPELEEAKPKHIVAHISRRLRGTGTREYAISNEEVVQRLGNKLVIYQELPLIWESGMGSHAFVTRHKNYEDMFNTIGLVQETRDEGQRRITRQMKREESARRMEIDGEEAESPVSATSSGSTIAEEKYLGRRSPSKRSLAQSQMGSSYSVDSFVWRV